MYYIVNGLQPICLSNKNTSHHCNHSHSSKASQKIFFFFSSGDESGSGEEEEEGSDEEEVIGLDIPAVLALLRSSVAKPTTSWNKTLQELIDYQPSQVFVSFF